MAVDSKHVGYDEALARWRLTRSIVDNNAKSFIRTVDANDPVRSQQYKDDAILTNFTRLTKIGLTGLVFRKPATVDLPEELEYLRADATGYGFGLEQLSQQVVGEILTSGRYGLLVDYPKIDESQNEEYARIRPYTAESIINWRYKQMGSKYVLSLVVLMETVELSIDGFEHEEVTQYRVLKLSDDGIYHQVVFDEDYQVIEAATPTDYQGNPLNEIPFIFVGSENNDAHIDSIPLYDLAIVNLGHYRNSADLEETAFISGQAVPVIVTGESGEQEFRSANPGGIKIGSRSGIVLGSGGSFQFAQVNPNILPRELMKDKEVQAVAIGARLISPPGGRETAEAARIRFGSQNSALYVITKNVNLAFGKCLYWLSLFMMPQIAESVFELNDQFYEETADPNLITANIMAFDRGLIKAAEVRDNMRDAGIRLDDDNEVAPVDPLQGVDDDAA